MDIEKAKRALIAADAAGDVEAATAIAKALKAQQSAQPQQASTGGRGSLDVLREMVTGEKAKPQNAYKDNALGASTFGVQQGLTGNFGDELFDAVLTPVTAGINYFKGDGFDLGKAYDQNREFSRNRERQAQEENPLAFGAGQVAGGVMSAGKLAGGGATLVGRTAGQSLGKRALAGAGEGAAYGAVYGAGDADEGGRLGGAAEGAVTGAALGGAIPVVGAGVKKAAAPIASMVGKALNPASAQNQAAANKILSEAEKAGLSADDLLQGARDGRTIGQQDVILSDLTRAVKRQPGEGRKIIDDTLNAGYQANNAAAQKAATSGLGAEPNFYMWRDAFAKANSKDSGKAYDLAFKQNWGKNGPPFELDKIVQSGRIPAEALRSAQKIAQAEGRPLGRNLVASIDDATGQATFSRLPSLEEAELIRRGLKAATSKAFRDGDGSLGVAYRSLENEMRGIIDSSSPALKNIRAKYATSMQIQEAADEGLKLLNKSADEIEFITSGMTGPELTALRKGLASDLKNKIERGMVNRDAVRQIFGSERNRRVLQSLWPDEKDFAKFQKQMENTSEFSAFRQNVQGNSRTQQDLADAGAMGGGFGGAVRNLATGNIRGAAVDALLAIGGRMVNPAKGLPPQQLRRMAEILVESNPEKIQSLLVAAQSGDEMAHRQLEMTIKNLLNSPTFNQRATAGLIAAN